jgi:nitrogen fixation protein NifZ
MKLNVAQEKMVFSSTKDEILPVFRIGEKVRLTAPIRNDGTYPHSLQGDILLEPGAIGYVKKIGDFLQTIRIYEVNFFEVGFTFGCREFELESIDDEEEHDEVAEELAWLKRHREERAKAKEQSQKKENS